MNSPGPLTLPGAYQWYAVLYPVCSPPFRWWLPCIQEGPLSRRLCRTPGGSAAATGVGEKMADAIPSREMRSDNHLESQMSHQVWLLYPWPPTPARQQCQVPSISKSLSWNTHVDNVTKKANQTLAFLRSNIEMFSQDSKEKAYKTFVRPTLEYAPHCT